MSNLQRYVSKELSHFLGRGKHPDEQYALLTHVIRSGWLTAPPHIPNVSGNLSVNGQKPISSNDMYNPQVICFCDIPIQDLHIHTRKYSRFGISFSKDFIANRGGTPVFYLPRNGKIATHHDPAGAFSQHPDSVPINNGLRRLVPQSVYFDYMVPKLSEYVNPMSESNRSSLSASSAQPNFGEAMELHSFLGFRLLSYFKFFDLNLEDHDADNYYMEREWRSLDNINFAIEDISRVFFPAEFSKQFRADFPDYYGQITFIE